MGLFCYSSTPLDDARSPGELLQGWKMRSLLEDFISGTRKQNFCRRPRKLRSAKEKALPELQKDLVVRVRSIARDHNAQVLDTMAKSIYHFITDYIWVLRRNRQYFWQHVNLSLLLGWNTNRTARTFIWQMHDGRSKRYSSSQLRVLQNQL